MAVVSMLSRQIKYSIIFIIAVASIPLFAIILYVVLPASLIFNSDSPTERFGRLAFPITKEFSALNKGGYVPMAGGEEWVSFKFSGNSYHKIISHKNLIKYPLSQIPHTLLNVSSQEKFNPTEYFSTNTISSMSWYNLVISSGNQFGIINRGRI